MSSRCIAGAHFVPGGHGQCVCGAYKSIGVTAQDDVIRMDQKEHDKHVGAFRATTHTCGHCREVIQPSDGMVHEFEDGLHLYLHEVCAVKLGKLKIRNEAVDHPLHYGGKDNLYEHIKVADAWGLNYRLGNATKYIARAGKKTANPIEDLKKARWYLDSEIQRLEGEQS